MIFINNNKLNLFIKLMIKIQFKIINYELKLIIKNI